MRTPESPEAPEPADLDPHDLDSADLDPQGDRSAEASRYLERAAQGDVVASERLYELLYSELHRRARGFMRDQSPDHTLQATALVHEAWLKIEHAGGDWESRRHFLNVATRAMRSVLVDHARARGTDKRGGDRRRVEPGEDPPAPDSAERLLVLDEALARLSEADPEGARVAELRLFGGLEHAEIARLEGVSTRTVERAWKRARAELQSALADPDD